MKRRLPIGHRAALPALALLTVTLVSGCSAGSPSTVTISEAISGIQMDLTKTGVVSVSGVQTWTTDQTARFDTNVQALQCAQQTSDPVVAMIAGPVTMALNGTFSQSGSFTASVSSMVPVFGLQADASRTKSQTLDLPIQFVPLSALPDAEMAREVGYAGDLLTQSDALRQSEGDRITASRDALTQQVQKLIGLFPGSCPTEPVHPFVGTRHRS